MPYGGKAVGEWMCHATKTVWEVMCHMSQKLYGALYRKSCTGIDVTMAGKL